MKTNIVPSISYLCFMKKSSGKKAKSTFVCNACGVETAKWAGQCGSCKEWSTLVEVEAEERVAKRGLSSKNTPVLLKEISEEKLARIKTGNSELDRTLGGGFVPGSLTLIGGDPGIGKSTLLLQTTALLAAASLKVLYVTGEESLSQIKQRARRLGVPDAEILLFCETGLSSILAQVAKIKPDVLIVDSIQTVFKEDLSGTPGSVTQVRECALEFMVQAKSTTTTTILVGHVTKEGNIAGPRILEHMVDTVVYFEGDRNDSFRLLRTIKNRFGSTNELGVLEMLGTGLRAVDNPSELFLQQNRGAFPGNIVTCSLEGSRSLVFEIQALVASSNYSVAQRVALGLDSKRLTLLIALLEKFGGIEIGVNDVFVSVVGGLKISDPATDLALAVSLAGNHLNKSLEPDWIVLGELGLNGDVRQVQQMETRIREAKRLGFNHAIIPQTNKTLKIPGMELHPVARLEKALDWLE